MQNNNHISKSHYSLMHHYQNRIEYSALRDIDFNTVARISVSGKTTKRQRLTRKIQRNEKEKEKQIEVKIYNPVPNEPKVFNLEKEINYQELDEVFLKMSSSAISLNKMRTENNFFQPLNCNLFPRKTDYINPVNGDNENEVELNRVNTKDNLVNYHSSKAKSHSLNIDIQGTKATSNGLNANQSGDNYSNTIRIPKEILNLINLNAFDLQKNEQKESRPSIEQIDNNILNNFNTPTQSSSKGDRNPNRESRKVSNYHIKKYIILL